MIKLEEMLKIILEWAMDHGIRMLFILVLTIIALFIAKVLTPRIFKSLPFKDEEQIKRRKTLTSVFQFIFQLIIITIAIITILSELKIEIGPIIAAAGILGLAVGFGAQSLVKDIISGFFILLADQVRIGDVVEIAGKSGSVEGLNLRMVTLRDLSGNVHYIPNGEITVVTNMTKGYSRYVFEIGVAYRENVDEVMDIMRQVDAEIREDPNFKDDILEPLEIMGLDKFGDSAVVIKARTTTKPIKQWRIGREFKRRLKIQFDEKGIEIPYPHLTLYMGKDKENQSPPLNITIDK
ncbi:mechanosensitive ion channel family protein [bacterium]|nr:mechanosensitive ion channel family protein [bacterium]MBU1064237.1 mechanosensitive ion channel family protein [bacterium]MBU1634002.1 mechanosensitive ion channel family protein [bacterium]MBU1874232.1 mechanosensitive ion channel family protein [bacterium]